MSDAALAGRFPFLPGAAAVLGDLRPSLRDLVEDPLFEPDRQLGRAGAVQALELSRRGGAGARGSSGRAGGPQAGPALPFTLEGYDEAKPETRVLGFLFERMLVSASPSATSVARRWSEGKARVAGEWLQRAPASEVSALARELDLEFDPVPDHPEEVDIAVPSFVRLSAGLRDERFRLARQPRLSHGRVVVDLHVRPAARTADASSLLEEGIRLLLAEELPPLAVEPELREALLTREAEVLQRMVELAPTFSPGSFGPVRPLLFPPCMREIRSLLDGGQNVAHAGRFALASFLHKVGVDSDGIVEAFHGAPNFKEGITRYQVSQITRHDGGAGYTPPDCATLAAQGLCFREKDDAVPSPCADPARLRNPLNYYRGRTRARSPAEPAPSPPPASPAP